jgi:hypothetical protein
MNFGEKPRKWKTPISCECICHATRSSHDTCGREKETHKWKDQQADSTSFTASCGVEDLEKWSSSGGDDIVDVSSDEEKDHQEYETCEDSNTNTSDHDLWSFNSWVGDFFDH